MIKKITAIIFSIFLMIPLFDIETISLDKSNSSNQKISSIACASWHDSYETVEELKNASDLIINGTVVSSKTVFRNNMVFTLSSIQVLSTEKGLVDALDTITILQTGGYFEDYYTPPFDEIPLLELNETYKLFLTKTEKLYYLISGGYLGVLKYNNKEKSDVLTTDNYLFFIGEKETKSNDTPTYAYYWNKSKLDVFVPQGISTTYGTNTWLGITNGIKVWHENTDSPWAVIVSNSNGADVVVEMSDYGETGWDANTTTYYDNNNICNYSYMRINTHYLSSYYSTTNLWQAIACHEFGHTLGLAHNTKNYIIVPSLMHPNTDQYYNVSGIFPKYKKPKAADKNPIDNKY